MTSAVPMILIGLALLVGTIAALYMMVMGLCKAFDDDIEDVEDIDN